MVPNPPPIPATRAFRVRTGQVVVAILLMLFIVSVVGVSGYFRLGTEAAVLRDSTLNSAAGEWHKRFAFNIGGMTTALARSALKFVKLDEEARLAAGSLHGAEVGIYQLGSEPACGGRAALVAQADKRMAARGWSKVVGVFKEHELVAVYVPDRLSNPARFKCAFLVLQGRDLVVGSVRGDLEPLAQLAGRHMRDGEVSLPHLAFR